MSPSLWQIAIVVVLVFLLFGAKRIPDMMENLAKGIKSFKGGLKDDEVASKSVENKDDSSSS